MMGKTKFRMPSFVPIKSALALRRIVRSKFNKLSLFLVTYLLLITLLGALYSVSIPKTESRVSKETLGEQTSKPQTIEHVNVAEYKIPTHTPPPSTATPTEIPLTITPTSPPVPQAEIEVETEVKQETTKTITGIPNDSAMGNATDIFNALNSYRSENGAGGLSWDSTLADLANSRASTFSSNNSLDGHTGFTDYMNNGGFEKSGFNGLGENSAQLSGPMGGDRIIREVYGASSSHNSSQLDPAWTHVGIAVNGNFVNVNFGKNKR